MGKSFHGNVVLNFRKDSLSEFGAYAEAYHEAGKLLVCRLDESEGYSDIQACPIVFLYRHALELYIKGIIIDGNNILSLLGKTPVVDTNDLGKHDLLPLIPAIKQVFTAIGWLTENKGTKEVEEVVEIIKCFNGLDSNSFSFRYPVNKKGLSILSENFILNVVEFAKKADPVFDLLDGAIVGLSEEWQTRADNAYENN
ncbi:hypothetical protein A2276_08675 [candidate division WOR-1 bacterium RIFOXYA12_FULL_43_27]|uniref:HEPN domain-containing protein n=1 Tax=candidate division WOR-1 bacterium RIFOXYC2_FULL_46_14 TaxID=1802587 RepID=A0A1F4U2M3_UNCSA|nr:MAG: hypothetical protein A2276_08675 [candidate division WOR-1 bacterium RIFOXYA12_FULL_43_27]OGC19725.1 MAG: hypothetical protein A2292_08540 [candidate division WOR-1 bacterium RIFOXYB2_FULL_46_45]OGC30674.1 MAG: hypothetical protein A2232_02865 [candidate division WOR-1 bacterium RIFOXYA2_FULL_46_56]OGC39225.1 MAG: hypothetical protein A2438_07580 [candidate division WOR-1 bacterium RIFOXYC2_FULL_46_14]